MEDHQFPEDLRRYINVRIATVDDMLLNAYGTVYKLAAKNIYYEKTGISLSETEEMLSAKNLMGNLWSILDYCNIIHYCIYNRQKPTSKEARSLKIPCLFPGRGGIRGLTKREAEVFGYLQYNNEENVPEEMKTFYQLHFLRNTLTHNTVDIIEYQASVSQQVPEVLQRIGVVEAPIAISIRLPEHPWSDSNDTEVIPLLDVLSRSCKLVEKQRDKMLFGGKKFEEKIVFGFTRERLTLSFKCNGDEKSYSRRLRDLHLECYGLEKDYKDELEVMRNY